MNISSIHDAHVRRYVDYEYFLESQSLGSPDEESSYITIPLHEEHVLEYEYLIECIEREPYDGSY